MGPRGPTLSSDVKENIPCITENIVSSLEKTNHAMHVTSNHSKERLGIPWTYNLGRLLSLISISVF